MRPLLCKRIFVAISFFVNFNYTELIEFRIKKFQLDFNECEVDSAIENVLSHKKLHEADCDFVRILVSGTRENLESIDKMIAEKSKDWKIERMSGIDRNIVRLAIFEMKFSSDKLVPNIAINEAVELAKKFGTDDSARFVNGILGSMIK